MKRTCQTHAGDCLCITVSSAFGLGLSPFAPGSFGTLLGVALHVLIVLFMPSKVQLPALFSVFILACVANQALIPWAEEYWQGKDPKNFVLDEVAGYLLVPILFRGGQLWQVVVWGFILFRLFDIIKIPPARQIDRQMQGGWGVLLDDLVSAGHAVLVMYFVQWAAPGIWAGDWLTIG